MKRLFFFGYAPAGKKGWPLAGLGSDLEPLDPRHGVFTNLVTTPILSALCYLPEDRIKEVVSDVKENVLRAGAGGRRRFNVLAGLVGTEITALDSDVKRLFQWSPGRVRGTDPVGDGTEIATFHPGSDVGLIFNFWAVAALFSYLIQGREEWTKASLMEFSERLLRCALMELVPGLREAQEWWDGIPIAFMARVQATTAHPKEMALLRQAFPERTLARLGLYFRLCTHADWDRVGAVLKPFIQRERRKWQEGLRAKTRDVEISPEELTWILSVLRSVVPLPHTEIYDRYDEENNPIGKWQDCFMSCQDPEKLPNDGRRPLFWQHAGPEIAKKLL
jgi:hypothetical protein